METSGRSLEVKAWLKVCVTCERSATGSQTAPSRGERLAGAIELHLQDQSFANSLALRRVPCLSGCRHPGAVALGASGKCQLRLHDIAYADAEAVVALARAFLLSSDGELPPDDWPERLVDRLATMVRPRIVDPTPLPPKSYVHEVDA